MNNIKPCVACDFKIRQTDVNINHKLRQIDSSLVITGAFDPILSNSLIEIPLVFVDDRTINDSIFFFDRYITDVDPKYRGLLSHTNGWDFDQETFTYFNRDTEETITQEELDVIQNGYLDIVSDLVIHESNAFFMREQTLQVWLRSISNLITNMHVSNYLLSIGGRENIDSEAYPFLEDFISRQFGFLIDFANEIAAGRANIENAFSLGYIINRLRQYIEASTNPYEQGKARGRNIILPAYPADGSQICLMRCRCRWVLRPQTSPIRGGEDFVHAFWTLNPRAQHCQTCISNNQQWFPYVAFYTGGRPRVDEPSQDFDVNDLIGDVIDTLGQDIDTNLQRRLLDAQERFSR